MDAGEASKIGAPISSYNIVSRGLKLNPKVMFILVLRDMLNPKLQKNRDFTLLKRLQISLSWLRVCVYVCARTR